MVLDFTFAPLAVFLSTLGMNRFLIFTHPNHFVSFVFEYIVDHYRMEYCLFCKLHSDKMIWVCMPRWVYSLFASIVSFALIIFLFYLMLYYSDGFVSGLFLNTFAVAAHELSPSRGLRANAAHILPWMSKTLNPFIATFFYV